MTRLARLVTGRRSKFVVIALWVVLAGAMAGPAGKLADATEDDFASFLPEGAESAEVQELLKERFPGGETANGIVVYRRDGGLTEQDEQKIERDADAIADAIPLKSEPVVPFGEGAP